MTGAPPPDARDIHTPPLRVLVLSHAMPYPLHDGYTLRIYHYVRHLRSRHAFHLICFGDGPVPAPLEGLFRSVTVIRRTAPPPTPRGLLERLDVTDPDRLFTLCPEMQDAVDAFLAREPVDMIWASGWHMPLYAYGARTRRPVFGDFIDEDLVEASRGLLTVRSPMALARQVSRLITAYRFERRYFGRADLCNLVSVVDAAAVRFACPGTATQGIPNGVDLEYFAPRPPEPDAAPDTEPMLVFEGNMVFPPNVGGAVWFVRNVWPLLRAQRPAIRFVLVGKDPAPRVQELAAVDGVEVTGLVPDVRDYLAAATAFVCPLQNGAGVKNKILQAWAMAKPVIATPVSCAGLRAMDGGNVVMAKTPREWAAAVDRVLRDASLRDRLGRMGRQTAEREYGWDVSARRIEASWLRMVRRCGACGRVAGAGADASTCEARGAGG